MGRLGRINRLSFSDSVTKYSLPNTGSQRPTKWTGAFLDKDANGSLNKGSVTHSWGSSAACKPHCHQGWSQEPSTSLSEDMWAQFLVLLNLTLHKVSFEVWASEANRRSIHLPASCCRHRVPGTETTPRQIIPLPRFLWQTEGRGILKNISWVGF